MKTKYVLGFLFSDTLTDVVLIRKQKPSWQVNLLNGVGGKIEPFERKSTAMKREFFEEAGVLISEDNWFQFCEMVGKEFEVYCFASKNTAALCRTRTMTSEEVKIVDWRKSKEPTIPNLEWLVPLARESFTTKMKSIIRYL